MKTIVLNDALKPIVSNFVYSKNLLIRIDKSKFVSTNATGELYHKNYLEYLKKAWSCHYGIVISPDIVWYTLLCEVAEIVKATPDNYGSLFTTMPGNKQTILVKSEGTEVLPLKPIFEELKVRCPTDINLFCPEFSTSNERSRLATIAAFADVVSPYYNYFMYSCGISSVTVLGTEEDWQKVVDNWIKLKDLFTQEPKYFNTVGVIVDSIKRNLINWNNIFTGNPCGSGSQIEITGWWSKLYYKQPSFRIMDNFSTNLAKVEYKDLSQQKDYVMYNGLISSNLDSANILQPEFGHIIYEKQNV